MDRVSQSQLLENIHLVRWQHDHATHTFNLLTIHSLLVDHNPKFQELRQIIEDYNHQDHQSVGRTRLRHHFVQQLYTMLSELTRIPVYENQVEYLNKVYKWATNQQNISDNASSSRKVRPGTASTRTRPFSAYSRANSGVRPPSGAGGREVDQLELNQRMVRADHKIDYDKLKAGERQFFAGIRTRHLELDPPKKRLKEYQRKIFYDDGESEEIDFIDEQQSKGLFKQPVIMNSKIMKEIEEIQNVQGVEKLEGAEGQNVGEVNIDDIPMDGQEDGGQQQQGAQEDQPQEVVDKLRPRVKPYAQVKGSQFYSKRKYYQGLNNYMVNRNGMERAVQQDQQFVQMQANWGNQKSRVKSEMKRRAQSARIVGKHIGVPNRKEERRVQNENFINLETSIPTLVNTRGSRPVTAFHATDRKVREQLLKNAFITGNIARYKRGELLDKVVNREVGSMTVYGERPKKRAFQDILRDAEEKVAREAEDQIMGVKEICAKNKISMPASKIAKSMTYYEKELPQLQPFVGQITGMAMIKNPFIKVTKKKKKKKKK